MRRRGRGGYGEGRAGGQPTNQPLQQQQPVHSGVRNNPFHSIRAMLFSGTTRICYLYSRVTQLANPTSTVLESYWRDAAVAIIAW